MKTFKLVSLDVVEDDQAVTVPLADGLIINKEDDHGTWLIEAYTTDLPLFDYFHKILEAQRQLIVEVTITKKENDPTFFQTYVSHLQKLDDHISILLEGFMRRTNKGFSESLLENLLKQGLTGDALLQEFKARRRTKPHIK